MTKIRINMDDYYNDAEVFEELQEEANYLSSRVVKSESLKMRDKEFHHGLKSKSRKARQEVL